MSRDAEAGAEPSSAGDATPGADAEDVIDELFAIIEDRRDRRPEGSYTASLFDHEKGENAVLEKLGEETTEVVLAAKDGDDEALVEESADLVYHLLVLLAAHDLTVADLRGALERRR